MKAQIESGLNAWSKDLEASSDVRLREVPAFAMLPGWLEKFVCGRGLRPGRDAYTMFWRVSVESRTRENWQLEPWGPSSLRYAVASPSSLRYAVASPSSLRYAGTS